MEFKDKNIRKDKPIESKPKKSKKPKATKSTYIGKFKAEQGVHRSRMIASCQTCNGDPPQSNNTLDGLEYSRCDICLEVIKYRKL